MRKKRFINELGLIFVVSMTWGCGAPSSSSPPTASMLRQAYPRPSQTDPLEETPAPPRASGNPFENIKLYVDGESLAVQAVHRAKREGRLEDAMKLAWIAQSPQAVSLDSQSPDVYYFVESHISRAELDGSTAILKISFDNRSGCAPPVSAESHRRWIRQVYAAIGERSAVVMIQTEPSIARIDGVSLVAEEPFAGRFRVIRDAVRVFRQNRKAVVYLNAENKQGLSSEDAALILQETGLEHAHGFVVNTFAPFLTEEALAYAREISKLVGGAHFVVDTSRNGAGHNVFLEHTEEKWCNPFGAKIGPRPTTGTGDQLCDAFLWLSRPGESDGECAGGPPTGEWWEERALGMVSEND